MNGTCFANLRVLANSLRVVSAITGKPSQGAQKQKLSKYLFVLTWLTDHSGSKILELKNIH